MSRLPEQFIEQVAQATDIVDLVSQYVALKKKGREFVGLCPFHDDKNPSMSVSPAKQIFKCFACGAGGGVYQWVMMYDKLKFPEAVRALAERAGIPVPQDSAGPPRREGTYDRSDLKRAMSFAAEFYRRQLHSPLGADALAYARKRGLSDEAIQQFGIGYAPDAWEGLLRAARQDGLSDRLLTVAGLAAQRDSGNGCYDRFRNRLMFPICDPVGDVIAFGGRALSSEERAKYLNSPETPLFDKSANLYGLNWARDPIVRAGQAVVGEGYLDVLLPHQHGVRTMVATLGTALTERHVRLLSRYASDVVLIFDADQAGQAAAERALEMFLSQQVNVRVATIPAGKDPCDFVLSDGPDALRQLIAEAPDALSFAWARTQQRLAQAGANLADRRGAIEEFLHRVVSSAAFGAIDPVRRGQLTQHIAHLLNIPQAELEGQMARLTRRTVTRNRQAELAPRPATAVGRGHLAERHVLEVLVNEPGLFDSAAERIDPSDFDDKILRAVSETVWARGHAGTLSLKSLLGDESLVSAGALLAELAREGQTRGNYEPTLRGAVDYLAQRRQRRSERSAEARYDESALRDLLARRRSPDPRRRPRIS